MLSAWRRILDSTEKTAQVHVACSDKFKNNICESLKECRVEKEGNLKKVKVVDIVK